MFLLGCDTSTDVRRAVLTSIAVSTKTLPAILERTRDVIDAVRKLAYQIIAEKVHIRALTIAQRVQLLQQGLNDRIGKINCNIFVFLFKLAIIFYQIGNIIKSGIKLLQI